MAVPCWHLLAVGDGEKFIGAYFDVGFLPFAGKITSQLLTTWELKRGGLACLLLSLQSLEGQWPTTWTCCVGQCKGSPRGPSLGVSGTQATTCSPHAAQNRILNKYSSPHWAPRCSSPRPSPCLHPRRLALAKLFLYIIAFLLHQQRAPRQTSSRALHYKAKKLKI
eukprot:EG_transcript_17618